MCKRAHRSLLRASEVEAGQVDGVVRQILLAQPREEVLFHFLHRMV